MSKISDKDKKDWNNFINSSQRVENKDKDSVSKENIQSYISIDLHGYTLDQANKKVSELILSSYEKGIRNINIITGKGNRSSNQQDPYQSKNLSILKYAIPDFITNNLDLMNKIIKIDYQAVNEPTSGSFSILLKKINYKINFERSVSFTNSPILSLIYLESTIIFSPDLSVAVKLISSRTLSIIV